MKKMVIWIALVFSSVLSYANDHTIRADLMKIRITSAEKQIMATLNNSQAARDFVALLSLDLTLTDYANTEKISNLPQKLSIEGAPSGYTPLLAILPIMRLGVICVSFINTFLIHLD